MTNDARFVVRKNGDSYLVLDTLFSPADRVDRYASRAEAYTRADALNQDDSRS